MKYGVILFKDTDNIGDDIQSYAARRFLPKTDYVLDRENLDTFGENSNIAEPVAVIMNGWYMHSKFNWPPSEKIRPLWVSVHIGNTDYWGIGDRFLNGMGGEYLKHWAPIGARDNSTLQMLKEKGIDAYLSGCMTLTLDLSEKEPRGTEVCLVDVDPESTNLIKQLYPEADITEITHNVPEGYNKRTPEERFQLAEELLKRYQRACCVVTSRLHCALPCLALGTPVLLIYEDEYQSRMDTFLSFLHVCTRDDLGEILKTRFDLDSPPENSTAHLGMREALIERCKRFVEGSSEEADRLPFSVEVASKHFWQKDLINRGEMKFLTEIVRQTDWIKALEETKKYLETQVAAKDARIAELEDWSRKAEEAKGYLETQVAAKDIRIAELEDWSQKAEEAKGYLETQVTAKDARIAELEDWSRKAEEAKGYLETQVAAKDARIAELEDWSRKAEEAKRYLETQVATKDARIAELENWIKELETAKEYLKEQWDREIQRCEQEQQTLSEMQELLEERDNTISKQKYKFKLLLNDKNIQKIIIKKQYEI